MLKKLLIRTWIGPLPPWYDPFERNVRRFKLYGWDVLAFPVASNFFKECVSSRLGVDIPLGGDPRKICEFDPALGQIFPNLVEDYDFWGHCNLDCVYGRLERFVPDSLLENCDIYADGHGSICGPLTLYRNTPKINSLFRSVPEWRDIFSSPTFHGFDEGAFSAKVSDLAREHDIRFTTTTGHAFDRMERHYPSPKLDLLPSGALIDLSINQEIPFFHFNHTRQWPIKS